MRSSQKSEDEADLLIERMRSVRSAGRFHVSKLQGEAKRMVDWKEYVLTKPIASVAAASILGFALIRGAVRAVPQTIPRRTLDKSEQSNEGSASSTFTSGAIALGASIASSALKSYFANLVQRSISEGSSK